MSGAMDRVFGNKAIVFNGNLCDYEAQLPSIGSVKIKCDDPVLERCMVNALLRNGINVEDSCDKSIEIKALDHIVLPNGEIVETVQEVVDIFQ